MIKYIKTKGELNTEFQFFLSHTLPEEFPISTPLTFAFIGQNLVITKKKNGWWDVLGGKIKSEESWIEALKREAEEEAGVVVDHINIVGYILAKNTGDLSTLTYPEINILPVTSSFVQSVDKPWNKNETLERDALARDEVKRLFSQRKDSGQLLEIFNYILEDYDSQGYEYVFEYVKGDNLSNNFPNTQSRVFMKTKDNKFAVVREEGSKSFNLPGGGCHMDETGTDCAIRESLEESQITIENIKLLGTAVVKIKRNEKTISESGQARYIANAGDIKKFVANKHGLETVERKFVDFNDLQKEVKMLQNATGDEILSDLKKYL